MDPTFVIIVSNTSIKNNITTSISHVYLYNNGIKKTIYHAVSVSLTNVIIRECGQTLGLGLVDKNRTVVNY